MDRYLDNKNPNEFLLTYDFFTSFSYRLSLFLQTQLFSTLLHTCTIDVDIDWSSANVSQILLFKITLRLISLPTF